MQMRICSCELDPDTGVTTAVVKTPIGEFTGTAKFNSKDDPYTPAKITGMNIAESRACIAALNEALKLKREQKKAIKRLIHSCDYNLTVYHYANSIDKAIDKEIRDIQYEKEYYQGVINRTIKARVLYTRLKGVDRKVRSQYLERIQQGLKDLGQLTSK